MRIMLLTNDRKTLSRYRSAAEELGQTRLIAVKSVTDALERLFREPYDALLSDNLAFFHPRILRSPVLWPDTVCLLFREPLKVVRLPEKLTFCFSEDSEPKTVLRRIGSFPAKRGIQVDQEVLISRFLQQAGVPVSLIGFDCMREAIRIILSMDSMTEPAALYDIYTVVAKLLKISVSVTEHAIRHAINAAWIRADAVTLERVFGYTIDAERATPSNAAFLFRAADHIKIHQGEGDIL